MNDDAVTLLPTKFLTRRDPDERRHGQVFQAIKGESFDACEYDKARDERCAKREGSY